MMPMDELEQDRAEAFAGRLIGVVNDGMLALMVSVGHRTGLFDVMAGLERADSATIAASAGLQERYVREWLGAMTTGGIVDFDAGRHVPPPTRACDVVDSGCRNREPRVVHAVRGDVGPGRGAIVTAFRRGRRRPLCGVPDFQRVMAEESAKVFDATLLSSVLPLVAWRRRVAWTGESTSPTSVAAAGMRINLMAAAFPGSRVHRLRLLRRGCGRGAAEAAASGLDNARFEVRDVATLGGQRSSTW